MLLNSSEDKLTVSWDPPSVSNGEILSYKVLGTPMKTYSQQTLPVRTWVFSTSDGEKELFGLHPGTHYNISLSAKNNHGYGEKISRFMWTEIGGRVTILSNLHNQKNKFI